MTAAAAAYDLHQLFYWSNHSGNPVCPLLYVRQWAFYLYPGAFISFPYLSSVCKMVKIITINMMHHFCRTIGAKRVTQQKKRHRRDQWMCSLPKAVVSLSIYFSPHSREYQSNWCFIHLKIFIFFIHFKSSLANEVIGCIKVESSRAWDAAVSFLFSSRTNCFCCCCCCCLQVNKRCPTYASNSGPDACTLHTWLTRAEVSRWRFLAMKCVEIRTAAMMQQRFKLSWKDVAHFKQGTRCPQVLTSVLVSATRCPCPALPRSEPCLCSLHV